MIPGWEGTATSLCVSLSTSSVKLEIKPGLVFFDNSHQKSQTQALQGPASTQATRKALPPCLSSPLPWAKLSLPTAPYPADWDQEWRPPRWRESGIPEPSPDSRSAEILAAPGLNAHSVSRPFLLSLRASPGHPASTSETPLPVFTPLSLELLAAPAPPPAPPASNKRLGLCLCSGPESEMAPGARPPRPSPGAT